MPDAPTGGKDAPVGGQAVLEGVMMKGASSWAVAVRAPTPGQREAHPTGLPRGEPALGPIELTREPFASALTHHRVLRLPILRGIVALAEGMRIGFRALNVSINTTMGEEGQEMGTGTWLFALVAGVGLAVGLFFVIPVTLTSLIKEQLGSAVLFWLVEGAVRTAIFVGYLVALTRLDHLRRLFEYHGAEHKAIAALEAGAPLTPEAARGFSRLHPRCGTSFMLVVMIVAVFALAPIGLPAWYWLVLSRIVGIPLVVGLSYEVIKATGLHRDAGWARIVMWPGMQLQRLTTREPDREQLEVAIAALRAVLRADGREPDAPAPAPAAVLA